MKHAWNARRLYRIFSVSIPVLIFTISTIAGISNVTAQAGPLQAFYTANPLGITFHEVRIPLRDGNNLAAYVVLPNGFDHFPAGSTFLTILSPGVNGRKEDMLWKAYNLANYGFVAIAVEARGNGDSTGIASFGIDEPADLSDAITWALHEYPAINPLKVSLLGQSLGGMFSVLAACKDPRIAATVAYHPPANFTQLLTSEFPIAQLVGGLPNFPLDNASLNMRSPINWINATVPHDILFLHGTEDTTVPPSNSLALSQKANDTGHNDTYVILRPGLDHTGNEGDPTSLTLAIAWLNYSLTYNKVPSPGVLWTLASSIVLHDKLSGSADYARDSYLVAAIALFFLLLAVLRSSFPGHAQGSSNVDDKHSFRGASLDHSGKLVVLGLMLATSLVTGILIVAGMTSLLWGYLLVFPLAVLGVLVALELTMIRKQDITISVNAWLRGDRPRNWMIGFVAAITSAVFFSLAYNASADAIKEPGMSVFNSAFACYTTIFFVNFFIDQGFMALFRGEPERDEETSKIIFTRHDFSRLVENTGLIYAWRLASIAIVLVFVPVVFYSGISVSINFLVLIGIPAIMAAVYFLGGMMNVGLQSRTIITIVIVLVLSTFLEYRIFRFF